MSSKLIWETIEANSENNIYGTGQTFPYETRISYESTTERARVLKGWLVRTSVKSRECIMGKTRGDVALG